MCKVLLVIFAFLLLLYFADIIFNEDPDTNNDGWAILVDEQPQKTFLTEEFNQIDIKERNIACHFTSYDCFDVYRCGAHNGKLKG